MSDEPKEEEHVTREDLEALRREMEARIQDLARQLAEARQRIRALEQSRTTGPGKPTPATSGGPAWSVRDGIMCRAAWAADKARILRHRVGLRTRLRGLWRWACHVGRAMREGPPTPA